MAHGPQTLSAGTIMGDDVKNPAGEDLGTIEEIMLDVEQGRVAYAVLSFGGFLGIGDKLFAIPWDALTLDTREECFILNVDKERLENAPGFDQDNWPQTISEDDTWLVEVYDYYGYRPYW
jgi:sporulation protein YlmC with PRC-barrel domain